MNQNKLLYNIVKIAAAAEPEAGYYYQDLPEEIHKAMAYQKGEQNFKSRIQDKLRRERLAQYVRDRKMSTQEAARRYQASKKINYTPDVNYSMASVKHPTESYKGYDNVMFPYYENKDKKLKLKAVGK